MFRNLVVSETAYELLFQEAEPVFIYQEGVYGDDRQQDRDKETGYPLWSVRVTASDAVNREEQMLEVRVGSPVQPEAGFRERVVLSNLRVQAYTRRSDRDISTMWYADAFESASLAGGSGSGSKSFASAKSAAPAKAAA